MIHDSGSTFILWRVTRWFVVVTTFSPRTCKTTFAEEEFGAWKSFSKCKKVHIPRYYSVDHREQSPWCLQITFLNLLRIQSSKTHALGQNLIPSKSNCPSQRQGCDDLKCKNLLNWTNAWTTHGFTTNKNW